MQLWQIGQRERGCWLGGWIQSVALDRTGQNRTEQEGGYGLSLSDGWTHFHPGLIRGLMGDGGGEEGLPSPLMNGRKEEEDWGGEVDGYVCLLPLHLLLQEENVPILFKKKKSFYGKS